MNDKLRECPMCGHTPMIEVMKKNKQLTRYKVVCSCGIMTSGCIDKNNAVVRWNTRHQPAHETVGQWEERTGERYPDTSPVYTKYRVNEGTIDDYVWSDYIWALMEWNEYEKFSSVLYTEYIDWEIGEAIVATNQGKP